MKKQLLYYFSLNKKFNLFLNLLLVMFLFSGFISRGQIIANGDFEAWTNGTPDAWTPIDSGIEVSPESSTVHGGSFAAKIDVTSTDQTKTDFRQTINLVSGHDYELSVWVYHTDGKLRARIYVDNNFYNYSDNSILGSWQKITKTFTASNSSIEIGLRFYDQASSSINEVVYIDDFNIIDLSQPTINVSPSSLTGFQYIEGNGPSAEQFFTVDGNYLTDDIIITPPTNWEISLNSGGTFQTTPIHLSHSGGNVSTTTIYIRMIAGLTANSYSGYIDCSSTGATTQKVAVDGNVSLPEISFTVSTDNINENGGTYHLTVTSNTTGNHTADLIISGGTAVNGTQYSLSTPIQLDFTTSTSYTIDLTINDNNTCDGNSNVIFGLNNPTNCTLGSPNELDLTIIDNEQETGEYIFARFEGNDTWGYNSSADIANDSNTFIDTHSLRLKNGAETVEFDNVPISGFENVNISVAYASSGVDSNEDLYMDISYDGGISYQDTVKLIDGYNNLDLDINTLSTNDRTPQGQNPYIFSVPTGKTSVKIRFRGTELEAGEYFYIDDVILSRNACNVCEEPTKDALFYSSSPTNLIGVKATLKWTSGDGTNRIVVMREAQEVSFVPTDNTSYTASSSFGSGTDVSGNGEYVIYNGNGSSIEVTNLTPGTLYYVKIYEYSCHAGTENYYTSGTPASDSFYSRPKKASAFESLCTTNDSVELTWSPPTAGNIDGYLIVARQEKTPHSVNPLNPNINLGENTNYSLAAVYGSTLPKSRIVYKGTDTSAIITGLTKGEEYIFKVFTYVADGSLYKYSLGKKLSITVNIKEVSSPIKAEGNSQVEIGWINPDNCYDEIMVVANETAGIDFTPTGDGTAYTPNSVYGGINSVVYKGTGTNFITTGLTNDTTYYFEIFVRVGNQWSDGIEISATPNNSTTLKTGDVAIMAVNTDIDNSPGSEGNGNGDQVVFVSFKDINPGTKIYLTDNGYERENPGKWGNTEGVIAITRLNNTLLKGTFITIEANSNTSGSILDPEDFDVNTCGGKDSNWKKEYIAGQGGFNLNNDDDIWIMQGGLWLNGTQNKHDAIYTGEVLYGWTESGWDNGVGNGNEGAKWSNYYPQTGCFTTVAPNGNGKVKFNDPNDPDFSNTSLDQLDWISLINTTDNWVTYDSNTIYNSEGYDYKGNSNCPQMTIVSSTHYAGKWKGKNNNNWFDCSNWDNLEVPDKNTSVNIDASAINELNINPSAAHSDLYNDTAQVKDVLIGAGKTLTMSSNALLEVYGDWTNTDGETSFIEGTGKVIFKGTTPQTIMTKNGTETEKFYDLEIDNPQGVLFSSGNIHAEGTLILKKSPDLVVPDGKYILANKGLINYGVGISIQNEGALVQQDALAGITDISPSKYSLQKQSKALDHFYEYVYWSSPIKQGSLLLGDIVSNAWNYYEYNPGDNSFSNYPGWIAKNANDIVEVPNAYAISAPKTTTNSIILSPVFSKNNDPFNFGDIQYTLKLGKDNDAAGDDDYNLIGNPYPSAIDFDEFAKDNPAVDGSYYAWTNCAGLSGKKHQADGYTTYSIGSGGINACDGTGTGLKAGRYIATAQGFMIEAINSGTITFKNTQRVLGNNDHFINKNHKLDRVWLDLTNSEGLFNQTLIAFSPLATTSYDRLFDAHNLESGNGQEFYSLANKEKLAIQGMPLWETEELIIPLGIKQASETSVNFHINKTEGILKKAYIYLWDKETGLYYNLKDSDYTTVAHPGEDNDRFKLVLRRSLLHTEEIPLENNSVVIFQEQESFKIKMLNGEVLKSLVIFNSLGQELWRRNGINRKDFSIKLSVAKGNILLFAIETQNNLRLSKKILVK